jgi:hypothetical protein
MVIARVKTMVIARAKTPMSQYKNTYIFAVPYDGC